MKEQNADIRVRTDTKALNRMGFEGSTVEEILENQDKKRESDLNDKYEIREYELMGKKFGVVNCVARQALAAAGNDIRYPDFDVHTVPELFKAGIEWYYKEPLNSRKIGSSDWPDVTGLITDTVKNKMKWMSSFDRIFPDGTDNAPNEYELISSFANYILQQIADMEIW